MRRIEYSTESDQIKVERTWLGKLNLQNDGIYDAQKVIWDINLKKIGNIGKFGDIGTGSIIAKNREIA
jgi:hypothetical protein